MAKTARIQDTVQLLCKMFADCGIPKISPEIFRQAKFDTPEACQPLWQFLFHVVNLVEHVKDNMSDPYRPDKDNTSSILCTAKVKIYFYHLGYTRSEFYNATYLAGSRELLLAFGWLLNELQLLSIMRAYHLEQARADRVETNNGYHLVVCSLLDEVLHLEEECEDINTKLRNGDQLCNCIQKLSWLNGRICISYRQLAETYTSLLKLMNQLNKYSHNESRKNHISFYGWYLLMHPQELSRRLKKLEHHVLALQSIMEWQRHDKIFWKWMESVIDAHKKTEIKSASEDNKESLKKLPSADLLHGEVDELYKKLARMLNEKEAQIKSINRMWVAKLPQIDAAELKKEMHRLDSEFKSSTIYYQVLEQQTPVFYENCSVNINKLFPEFIYIPTAAKPSAKSHQSRLHFEQISQTCTVRDETGRLKQSVAEVDEKLLSLRTEIREEFDKLISSRKLTAFCV